MSSTDMHGFKKIHSKLWEMLITQTIYRKVWRTDGQTDRQGQILMPPDYRHSWLHKLATPYWSLTWKLSKSKLKPYLKIVSSPKCRNFVKNYFFPCKNSHAHLQYIHNKCAWFQNDPLKTVRGVDYTNSIPHNAESCLKWLSSKGCNSVKN